MEGELSGQRNGQGTEQVVRRSSPGAGPTQEPLKEWRQVAGQPRQVDHERVDLRGGTGDLARPVGAGFENAAAVGRRLQEGQEFRLGRLRSESDPTEESAACAGQVRPAPQVREFGTSLGRQTRQLGRLLARTERRQRCQLDVQLLCAPVQHHFERQRSCRRGLRHTGLEPAERGKSRRVHLDVSQITHCRGQRERNVADAPRRLSAETQLEDQVELLPG